MEKYRLPHHHGGEENVSYLREELRKTDRFERVSEWVRLMSDPVRVRVFWLLSHREECVINISAMLGMTSPAISHHLRIMKDCGVIESRREGKEVYYQIAHRPECELLHRMIEGLMEIKCPEERQAAEDAGSLMERVHRELLEHLDGRITIEQLSEKYLINPTTLKREFKRRYGESIAAHILGHRMREAARLLAESEHTVAEIAERVGFSGQSRFTVAFSKFHGVTPSAYRKGCSIGKTVERDT